ncbi:hypothetical protein [Streptomyces sp. NPDC002851]
MWYAQNPGRRARQLIGDGAVLLWAVLCAALAVTAHRFIQLLLRPAQDVEAAGRGYGAGLPGPGPSAARVPLVGARIDAALRELAGAGDRLVTAGDRGQALVDMLAIGGAVGLFVLPVGLVLALWLPRRVRWVRQAAAARELAASEDGREILALRALMRPLDEVARTAAELPDATPGSLAEGWRNGDPETLDTLADAELERLGLVMA